jgi:hypothetical protein
MKTREKLKEAQSHQKSYSDKRRSDLSFAVGDFVYLKVSPIRGTQRFQVRGKLTPWYIGPYKVLQRIGAIAYRIHLLKKYQIYTMFFMSLN